MCRDLLIRSVYLSASFSRDSGLRKLDSCISFEDTDLKNKHPFSRNAFVKFNIRNARRRSSRVDLGDALERK